MHRLARASYIAVSLLVLSGTAPAAGQLDAASQRCIDAYHATLRLVAQETDRWARRCLREGEVERVDDVEACLSGDASGRIARRADRVARLYPSRCDGDEPIQQGAAAGTTILTLAPLGSEQVRKARVAQNQKPVPAPKESQPSAHLSQ